MIQPTTASRLQSVVRQFLKVCTEEYSLDPDHRLARAAGSCRIAVRAMNLNIIEGKEVILISCIMGGNKTVDERYVEMTIDELADLSLAGEDYA